VLWLALIPATTFGLGAWQLYRLKWKTDLINTIEMRFKEPPLELDITPAEGEAGLAALGDRYQWRRVTFTGQFQHDKELYIVPRTYKSIHGFHVVTPLKRTSDGLTILVNRGFIPSTLKDRSSRPLTLPTGEVTVVGILRDGTKVTYSSPPSLLLFL